MIICHRHTQTYTDISIPRLAELKGSSRSNVRNPLIWRFPSGWLVIDLASLGAR